MNLCLQRYEKLFTFKDCTETKKEYQNVKVITRIYLQMHSQKSNFYG